MQAKCTGSAFSLLCHFHSLPVDQSQYDSTDTTKACFSAPPDVSCYVDSAPWPLHAWPLSYPSFHHPQGGCITV